MAINEHEKQDLPLKVEKKRLNSISMIGLGFELGYMIALPVVVLGLLGKWLDQRFETQPIITMVGVFTAMIFTSIWIYRKFKRYV